MSTDKKHLTSNNKHTGGGRINPTLSKEISNLCFVVGNKILGDDTNAIIMSLVNEFNVIAQHNLKHNLELAQNYAVDDNSNSNNSNKNVMICGNCEIILRYIDTTICIKDGRIISTDENGSKEIECSVSHGMVKFFIRQKDGDVYKYLPIHIVRVHMGKTLDDFSQELYQDNEQIKKIEEATKAALAVGQSQAMKRNIQKGGLNNATDFVDNIIDNAKNASIDSQFENINVDHVMPDAPTQEMIDSANTVANFISKTDSGEKYKLKTVVVPGNKPIPLSDKSTSETAIINKHGITLKNDIPNETPFKRANIPVDANVVVLPTEHNTSYKRENGESNESESFFDKLQSYAKHVYNEIKGALIGVTPVSSNLSVVTPKNNSVNIPMPNSETKAKIDRMLNESPNIKSSINNYTDNIKTNIRRNSDDIAKRFKRDSEDLKQKYNNEIQNAYKQISSGKEKGKNIGAIINQKIQDIQTKFNRDIEDLQRKYNSKTLTEDTKRKLNEQVEKFQNKFRDETNNALKYIGKKADDFKRKISEEGNNFLKQIDPDLNNANWNTDNIKQKIGREISLAKEKGKNTLSDYKLSPTSDDDIPSDFVDSLTSESTNIGNIGSHKNVYLSNNSKSQLSNNSNNSKSQLSNNSNNSKSQLSNNSNNSKSQLSTVFEKTKEKNKYTDYGSSENPLKNATFSDIFTEDKNPGAPIKLPSQQISSTKNSPHKKLY